MEKWLCWGAMGVAGLLLVVFLLDLITGFPFSGAVPEGESSPFTLVDIAGLLASAIIFYLGWNAYRDIR
ncbi:MAG TPA: DUF350 domain-containing protein [Gemmataceae bacterium]